VGLQPLKHPMLARLLFPPCQPRNQSSLQLSFISIANDRGDGASILEIEPKAGQRHGPMAPTAAEMVRFPEICSRLRFPEIAARRWKIGNHRAERMSAFESTKLPTATSDYGR
jgi:hypothetical protein